MKRRKTLLIIFFLLVFGLVVFAQELEYPGIPVSKSETITVTETTTFPEYVRYLFGFYGFNYFIGFWFNF